MSLPSYHLPLIFILFIFPSFSLSTTTSDYLRRTGFFVPPLATAESCWSSFQSFIDEFQSNFDIRSSCGFQTSWISQGCMNITTKQEFEKKVSLPALQSLRLNCNTSLDNNAHCALCTTKCSEVLTTYLTGIVPNNVTDCRSYTAIYAASLSDDFGPINPGTTKCLFDLDFPSSGVTVMGSGIGSGVILLLAYSILALFS
ncbi:hypothetical protein P8452_61944 [Trifolium repens]|nr:hypothetical protein P8452_61944 [Trifolium repens]